MPRDEASRHVCEGGPAVVLLRALDSGTTYPQSNRQVQDDHGPLN